MNNPYVITNFYPHLSFVTIQRLIGLNKALHRAFSAGVHQYRPNKDGKITIRTDQLKFWNDQSPPSVIELFDEENPLVSYKFLQYRRDLDLKTCRFGQVCSLAQDRAPNYDLFIIINMNLSNIDGKDQYQVIFPRMKMHDGKLLLGQDKERHSKENCKYPYIFSENFIGKDQGNYQVHTIDRCGPGRAIDYERNYLYDIECQPLDEELINDLDRPLFEL